MRKLLYISLLVIVGCETPLTLQPIQPPNGNDLSSYFWPDTTASYSYQSPQGNHLVVLAGATIFDHPPTGSTATYFVARTSNSYSISGFMPNDIFGFDPWLGIVADTNAPQKFTESISSIATVGFNQQSHLFALSNSSALYQIDPNSRTIGQPLGNLPPGFVLSEDAHGQVLFAYQPGGDSIMWTNDLIDWAGDVATAPITAFTSAYGFSSTDLAWFACGSSIYHIAAGGALSGPIATLGSNIITMSPDQNGVFVGTSDGLIYDVSSNGQAKYRQTLPGLKQLTYPAFFNTNIFAATSSGLYAVTNTNKIDTLQSGNFVSAYYNGSSVFASRQDSVFNYNTSNLHLAGAYPTPASAAVPSYARFNSSASGAVYALCGTSIFALNNSLWSPIDQTVTPPWNPTPGALTLLKSDSTTWLAGYIANFATQQRYAYHATSYGPYPTLRVDSTTYSNVLTVQYTAASSGGTDLSDIPAFVIYYQKGIGPIRIERTEGTNTSVTKKK